MKVGAIEIVDAPNPYDSVKGRGSIDSLKASMPSCNYVGINVNIYTSASNAYVTDSELSKTSYAISYARTKGYKIIVRLLCRNWEANNAYMESFVTLCRSMGEFLQARNVEIFSMGGETLALEYPQYFDLWNKLIDGVREVYQGKITYNTNWAHNQQLINLKLNTSWYSRLDIYACSLYPRLILPYNYPDETPSVELLREGWTDFKPFTDLQGQNIINIQKSIAENFNLPLLLFIGMPSQPTGALGPPFTKAGEGPPDNLLQARYFESLFLELGDIYGIHVDGAWLSDKDYPPTNNEQTIQNRIAQEVIEEYFSNTVSDPPIIIKKGMGAIAVVVLTALLIVALILGGKKSG